MAVNLLMKLPLSRGGVSVAADCFSNKVLLTNGGRVAYVFEYENGAYKKFGNFKLSNGCTSVSCGPYPWVIMTSTSGDIVAVKWENILKVAAGINAAVQPQDDIFSSLLREEPMEVDLPQTSLFSALQPTTLRAFLGTDFVLLVANLLLVFSCTSKCCCTLSILKPSGFHPSNGLPMYSDDSIVVLYHQCPLQMETMQYITPHALLCPSSNKLDGVYSLSIDLFTYLFGSEDSLNQSVVILYGCQCGLVLGSSLKRLPCSSANLICNLDQPVLSIHPLILSGDDTIFDGLLIIGASGKIILFKTSSSSSVSVQEIVWSDCIISSLVIQQSVLLLSTSTSVKSICLKSKCLKESVATLGELFESTLTILYAPFHLLSYCAGQQEGHSLLVQSVNGSLSSVALSPGSFNVHLSESLSCQLKSSLKSIEATAKYIKELDKDINSVNQDLTKLNEVLFLFGEQVDRQHLSSPPLTVKLSIDYDQVDLISRKPFLNVNLSYTCSFPLKKGCILNVEVSPGQLGRSSIYLMSSVPKLRHDNGSSVSSFSLEGLNSSINLKVPLTSSHLRLNIRVYLSFCPSLAFSVANIGSCCDTAMIVIHSQLLTLLDFIQPTLRHQTSFQSSHSTTLTLSSSTIQLSVQSNELSYILGSLLGKTCARKEALSDCISLQKGCNGDVAELQGLLPDNSLVAIKLYKKSLEEELYILNVTGSTLSHVVEIADVISLGLVNDSNAPPTVCDRELYGRFKELETEFISTERNVTSCMTKTGFTTYSLKALNVMKDYLESIMH